MGRTLSEKVWDEHVVRSADGEPDLLFIEFIPLGFGQYGPVSDAPVAKRHCRIPELVAQLKRIIGVKFIHAVVSNYRAISSKFR